MNSHSASIAGVQGRVDCCSTACFRTPYKSIRRRTVSSWEGVRGPTTTCSVWSKQVDTPLSVKYCNFVKKLYTSTDNLFYFNHFIEAMPNHAGSPFSARAFPERRDRFSCGIIGPSRSRDRQSCRPIAAKRRRNSRRRARSHTRAVTCRFPTGKPTGVIIEPCAF